MRNLNLGAIYHMPWLEYRHAMPDGRIVIRVRTARGDFDQVVLKTANHYNLSDPFSDGGLYPMTLQFRTEMFDYYEAIFSVRDPRLKYLFLFYADGGRVYKLDGTGLRIGEHSFDDISESFAFAYAYPPAPMPEWARGCVGYQVFPDRFRREGGHEDGLEPWTSDRVQSEYRFGGNLNGIRAALPYLKDLGVQMLYTTPIFVSDSAHRYNTFDYYQIDPLLGTLDDFKALCDEAHAQGIRIILDGVFNHCGVGFAPFRDAQEKGEHSEYRDWFFFDDLEPFGYRAFGHWPYMPKLNLQNKACADYFMQVGKYWLTECHADGWRLDVSPEVYPAFWGEFHREMKRLNPECLIIAECWDDSRQWITLGDQFDTTMHYMQSRSIWKRFATQMIDLNTFDASVNDAAMLYPQRNQDVLWTFLGSHDTERFLTRAGCDRRKLFAAAFFQFTSMGIPIIYYGDELGMEGGADPDNRRPMRWDWVENNETRAHFQTLAHLRAGNEALRLGAFRTWQALPNGLYAYERYTDNQRVLCVLNTGAEAIDVLLPLPQTYAGKESLRDLYAQKTLPVDKGSVYIQLGAFEGLILE
ncbi:MAG TPA: glycoside hydrolase family 13 protein [Candidatus Limiplasma sp.]|nr:glycoside hydrolase family 13 protein [Candidatus Limiplasma sp.]HRX08908.1 glycoside hydrolase family 13 protein [Candidatus Limiplasma sp.]